MKATACPVCTGPPRHERHAWLFRCDRCGFLWSDLQPAVQDGTRKAAIDEGRRGHALKTLRKENFRQILDLVGRHVDPAGKTLLDVGCAHGWFPAMSARRGFQVLGIEPDPEMAAVAAGQGVCIRTGYFPEVLALDERFDLVSFNDVFEHLPDVSAAMAACARHLRADGLLVVNLPSSQGLFYRLADQLDRLGMGGPFERMWQKNFASPHLSYFTPDLLARLARKSGFRELERSRLETVTRRGLWARLRYDRRASILLAAGTWLAVAALAPLIRFSPPDIHVQLFRLDPARAAGKP